MLKDKNKFDFIKCSEYFCEACGDCLYCYWEDPCLYAEDGKHVGVLEDGTTFTAGGPEVPKWPEGPEIIEEGDVTPRREND